MKELISRFSNTPHYAKGQQWGKLIAITGGAQALVQLTSLVSGILIIRLLATQEYALYTLANTMLGTMVMLADTGISSGVMAEAGKVWQDKTKLGIVLATGLHLRKKFALYTLVVTLPILIYLLLEHKATWLNMSLIVLSIVPAFSASLSDTLLEIAPKLHQDINSLQRNQVEVNVGRLILSALLIFVFPFTFVALIANGFPRIYGNYKLRKISAAFISNADELDPVVEKRIMIGVKRTLPIVLYHCISGQISIWLISLFGTTTNIAQLGALGRLSMIFTLFSVLFSTLVIPRFARIKTGKEILLRYFVLVQISTMVTSLAIMASIWLLSNQILWVLGSNYRGLHKELLLMSLAGCVSFMTGISSQLIISRGWFMNPYYFIGLNFISTVIFISVFQSSSLMSILYYGLVISVLSYLLNSIFGFLQINKTILVENY